MAQWLLGLARGLNRSFNVKESDMFRALCNCSRFAVPLAALLAAGLGIPSHAALLGPTPYLSSADSPFAPFSGFSYFHLETFEALPAGLKLSTPGVSVAPSSVCVVNRDCFVGTGLTDSVDADNGPIDGFGGVPGHDLFNAGVPGITFIFDAGVLGALPNAVGIVWTDGEGTIAFEAFDESGLSLGTVTGTHAGAGFTGQTDEDRFYGATNPGGISRLVITNSSGGIEVDHLQYGLRGTAAAIPEPGSLALLGLGLLVAHGWSLRRAPR